MYTLPKRSDLLDYHWQEFLEAYGFIKGAPLTDQAFWKWFTHEKLELWLSFFVYVKDKNRKLSVKNKALLQKYEQDTAKASKAREQIRLRNEQRIDEYHKQIDAWYELPIWRQWGKDKPVQPDRIWDNTPIFGAPILTGHVVVSTESFDKWLQVRKTS